MSNPYDALEALDRLTAQLPADPGLDRDLDTISAYLHEVTDPERPRRAFRDASDDQLAAATTRTGRRLRIAALATVASFVAGVRLDGRYFRTALVPLTWMAVETWAGSHLEREIRRRTTLSAR